MTLRTNNTVVSMSTVGPFLRRLPTTLLDAAFPNACLVCRTWIAGSLRSLCDSCEDETERIRAAPFCRRCGRTIPAISQLETGCRGCGSEQTWNVAEVARVGSYDDSLKTLVLAVKYAGNQRAATLLSRWLADAIAATDWGDTINALVPVPMHWKRRLQRPCNHARQLATLTGKHLRRPVIPAVSRIRYAPSQTVLRVRSRRFDNVKGCFGPGRRFSENGNSSIAGKTVCIIDNFLSSGATLYEVAKEVRKAGAKRIYAAIVARSALSYRPRADWEAVADDMDDAH